MIITILIFIVVLVVLIISHELGHFIAAKLFGVQVDEFGLGFPPKIFGKKYGETEYTLNWLPFGGFVKIVGEDSEDSGGGGPTSESLRQNPRSFAVQPTYKKIIILTGGVIGNLLLAWLLLFISLQTGLLMPLEGTKHPEYFTNVHVAVAYVADGSPAEKSSLQAGDTIEAIGQGVDRRVVTLPGDVQEYIRISKGLPIALEVRRAGEQKFVTVTPMADEAGTYRIGIALAALGEAHEPFFAAIGDGAEMTIDLTKETAIGLYHFAAGLFAKESTVGQVSGPVGIFTLVGSASSLGFAYILAFMALLSINLAVLNILPIPALDGGRVLISSIEKIKGSPVRPELIQKVHSVGFVVLIVLMLVITANDIVKLF